ncbi:MAG TPA: type II toxin-antitoxin system VapC family toxin [Pyrinomonadaceae bacterium]|jgi:predicted nucleic acid-binding protein
MSRYIVDASIAVKLYVPEVHSQQAIQFFSDQHELIAPDLMLAEFGNIIWKKVRLLGELTSDEGKKIMAAAQTLPLVYHSTVDLINDAFKIALNAQRTVYDSLYVALAASQGCQLMTDDRKLHSALQQTSRAAFLTLIENY